MNYELAKRLKDAGFPQEEKNGEIKELFNGFQEEPNPVYIPTLEELIEACGERFIGLDRMDGGFRACGSKDSLVYCDNETPIEAVANLYIALNENKE